MRHGKLLAAAASCCCKINVGFSTCGYLLLQASCARGKLVMYNIVYKLVMHIVYKQPGSIPTC